MTGLPTEIELFGGPLDGQRQVVKSDEDVVTVAHSTMYVRSPDEPHIFVHVRGT